MNKADALLGNNITNKFIHKQNNKSNLFLLQNYRRQEIDKPRRILDTSFHQQHNMK